MEEVHIIRDEAELAGIAEELVSLCVPKEHATVIALEGDLGAGKTALTKAIARELGIEEQVTSPTFVIMKTYHISQHPFLRTLVHIDAYRIEHDDEMRVLGFDVTLADPSALVVIEWPGHIASLIPSDARKVVISLDEGGTRSFIYAS